MEDDIAPYTASTVPTHFNPRPPCGGRHPDDFVQSWQYKFQSTSSMWRTTWEPQTFDFAFIISIHVLHVEDDKSGNWLCACRSISIHVLHVEDDVDEQGNVKTSKIFQSTSSMWRTTWEPYTFDFAFVISIHVLHVEDDLCPIICFLWLAYFNPRPPCGGRRFRRCSSLSAA